MAELCGTGCNYNQTAAYNALYFSYASYCDSSNLHHWDCKWCRYASTDFQVDTVISTNYLQAFMGIDYVQDRVVISFRGTHNYEDWVKDMEYKQIPYPQVPNAYVHEGFYNAYSEIQQAGLTQSLQQLLVTNPNITNVLLTGHSLGGALSNLCALDIIDNQVIDQDIDIEIYTFGCPRWANKELAHYFDNLDNVYLNYRVVNKNDPVAILPGKFLGEYGFWHTSTEVLYTDYHNLEYRECDGSGEDPDCGYSLWSEDKDSHLWYLNEHENCNDNYHDDKHDEEYKGVSLGSPAVTNNTSNKTEAETDTTVHTHWVLSLIIVCIGFVVGFIYYFAIKAWQKMNGYQSIDEWHKEQKKLRKKRKKVIKAPLMEHQYIQNTN